MLGALETRCANYIKGRTSTLVNNTWKNNLQRMEAKAYQATTLDELRNVERMARSYYEDLVSAMNVLYSVALKYSASYTPHVKQSNLLKTLHEDVVRAVTKGVARLEETANERKRSRGGTPPVHSAVGPATRSPRAVRGAKRHARSWCSRCALQPTYA